MLFAPPCTDHQSGLGDKVIPNWTEKENSFFDSVCEWGCTFCYAYLDFIPYKHLFVFRSFSHDPGSGLAGILFEVVQRAARNASHYRTKQHLPGQAKKLNVGSLAIFRDIQHLEGSLVTLCNHYLAILRHEFFNVCHPTVSHRARRCATLRKFKLPHYRILVVL
jgi:hypothetical protein